MTRRNRGKWDDLEAEEEEKLYRRRNPLRSTVRAASLSFHYYSSALFSFFVAPFSFTHSYLSASLRFSKGSSFPPFWLFSTRVTIAKMRSDSGEILAKIPPFILISFLSSVCTSSPTSFGNPIYTNPRARTLLEDSPGGRLYPRIVERFFGGPVGLSSPFTSPKCSVYNIVTLLESAAIFFLHLHKGWISSNFLIRSLCWLRGR